jgi:hypothetical protein
VGGEVAIDPQGVSEVDCVVLPFRRLAGLDCIFAGFRFENSPLE